MKDTFTVIASFGIMLCLGSVYAWSIFVPELINTYHFSGAQTQIIFGLLIAVFATTMIFAGRMERTYGPRFLTFLSALLFFFGYLLAGLSKGNFMLVLTGIGIFAGIGTGLGYLVAITAPSRIYPEKNGLVTGISAAGFGLAAVLMSGFSNYLFGIGKSVTDIFIYISLIYGLILLFLSLFMNAPPYKKSYKVPDIKKIVLETRFLRLFLGILFGTFAGLLIIGNLRPMGQIYNIPDYYLVMGISAFAISNFSGRILWGLLSDNISPRFCVLFALSMQAVFLYLFGYLSLNTPSFIILSFGTGFCFGANFVLFAKETAKEYGLDNLGSIYPFIFLGYAIAGILGPMTGGLAFDLFGNYSFAAYLAGTISIMGALTLWTEPISLPVTSKISGK